jgi:E3 ubiquitin-protein ligase SHPRH
MTKIKENFDSYEPFDLIDPSFTHLRLPIDVRGLANTKARGFNVSLPSKLQPQNVKPLLRGVDYPYAQFGKEWLVHSEAWDSRNWIHAALALDPNQPQTRKAYYRSEEQRVFLKSGIKAVWEEEGDVNGEDAHATLSLILTIDCFVDLRKIWDPLPGMGSDLMGLIFYSLLPSPCSSTPMVDSEKREDSLRYFYSCLRPAPPVPYSRSVQPSNMPTKLLPFQNRTVAWLLQRERAPVAEGLEGCRDPEGFWTAHKIGHSGDTAYRRLTGELVPLKRAAVVPDRKGKGRAIELSEDGQGIKDAEKKQLSTLLDLSKVEGTMLCEEMGKSFVTSICQLADR